jgi:hypothetical protein
MTKESRWSNEKIIYGFVVLLEAEYDHVQPGTQIWIKRCTQNNEHTNKTLRAGVYPILIHRGQLQSTRNFCFLRTIALLSSYKEEVPWGDNVRYSRSMNRRSHVFQGARDESLERGEMSSRALEGFAEGLKVAVCGRQVCSSDEHTGSI